MFLRVNKQFVSNLFDKVSLIVKFLAAILVGNQFICYSYSDQLLRSAINKSVYRLKASLHLQEFPKLDSRNLNRDIKISGIKFGKYNFWCK